MPDGSHLSDDDLERYAMGAVKDEGELAALEGHLLVCGQCIQRAEREQENIKTIRAALEVRLARGKRA